MCLEYVRIGLLAAVGTPIASPDLLNSTISLSWTPPFSLDITNVDHDITYCVGVDNSTSLVVFSQCGITDTQYDFTVSFSSTPCDNYTFTVTPVNEVGNGTSFNRTLLSSIRMGEIMIITNCITIAIAYILI